MRSTSALCLLLLFCACSKPKKEMKKVVKVSVTHPEKKDAPIFIQIPGNINALQTVKIMPQVSGQITSIEYKEGQFVNEGDLLATIDDRTYLADLMQSEGLLLENQAQLRFAQDTLNRNKPLAEEEFISQNELDRLETNVQKFEALIDQNLASIEEAKINVDYCYIKAPISGVIGVKKLDVGNVVSQLQESDLVTINQVQPVYANYFVPEKDLYRVMKWSKGNKLKTLVTHSTNFGEDVYEGTLEFIDNQVDQKTGLIQLRSVMPNKELMLWPGQYINVRLILHTQKDAIIAPITAVQQSPKGPYVYVIDHKQTAEMRYIEVGEELNGVIIINKGLTADDTIVTKGQLDLYPGAKVSITNKEH